MKGARCSRVAKAMAVLLVAVLAIPVGSAIWSVNQDMDISGMPSNWTMAIWMDCETLAWTWGWNYGDWSFPYNMADYDHWYSLWLYDNATGAWEEVIFVDDMNLYVPVV